MHEDSKWFNSLTKTIHFAHLGILFIYDFRAGKIGRAVWLFRNLLIRIQIPLVIFGAGSVFDKMTLQDQISDHKITTKLP